MESSGLGPGGAGNASGAVAFPDAGFVATANRVPVLLWGCADDRRVAWCNDAWTDFTGLSCDPRDGEGWSTAVHPDDLDHCLEVFREAAARREGYTVEYRLRRRDGEYRWMVDRGVPWRSRTGEHLGYAGVCVDVHENRTALEEFRLRERQHAIVADLGRFALEVEDEQELLDRAVKLLADGLGVPLTAAMRLDASGEWLDITAGTGWDAVLLGSSRVAAPGSLAAFSLATDAPVVTDDLAADSRFDGGAGLRTHGVVSAMSTVIRMPGGPYGVLGAYSSEPRAFSEDDILFARSVANLLGAWFARREVEAELRARELEARLAITAGRMGSWRWDVGTGTVAWSSEMEAAYGLAPGTFEGTFDAFLARLHPDDRDDIVATLSKHTAEGTEFSLEHRAVLADGTVRWFEGRGSPVHDADGAITSWFGVGIDITDRKQREQDLRDYEYETSLAFGAGHMGSWRWNARESRGRWSPELEDLVGVPRGSYDGTWAAFVAPILVEDGPRLRDAILDASIRGDEFVVDYRIRRPDGVIRWLETRGRELEDGDWVGVSIDVTDKRVAEDALREANARLRETVARLDTLLANAPLGFAFFDRDLRFVGLNQPLAEINGLEIDEHLGRRIADVLPDVGPVVEDMLSAVRAAGAPLSDVELAGQTPAQPGVERHWLASFYPVAGADEDAAAGLGAIVVEITEQKRQERIARLTGAVSELLAASPDLSELLARAAAIMVPELADSCGIYLLPRTGVARRFAVAHIDPEMKELLETADARWPLDIERMLAMSAELRAGRSVSVAHVSEELRELFSQGPEHLAVAQRLGVQSSIVAPLHVGDDVVGLLFLDYTTTSGRVYQDADIDLAEALADRLVGVLERAYLTAEAARARGRLDLLAAVSELLTVGLDTRARLDAVTDVVLPTFGDACVAYLFTDDNLQPVTCKIVREGDAGLVPGPDVPVANVHGPGPVATAFRTREPVLIRDVPDDLGEPARLLGLRSLLVVPLLSAAQPIGVLVFGYSRSERRYAPEDLALAREIAGRVAPAVEDAMQFERELATAEALQRSLLPDQLPVLQDADLATRYVPGGVGLKVGGDWYDAVPLRDGRVMLVIGDVVGHGVRAAASMGKLRNVLQYSALDGLEPAQVLTRLNAYFCALTDADMATLLVAEYDPSRQRIVYANAGHPPAMLRLPDGTIEALDDGRSMPLCASDQAQYQQAERDLPAGSTLVLYTDGLVERRGESLDVGLARLETKLGAAPNAVEDVADALLRDFLADDAPADDVALLCVRVRGPEDALRLRLRATARELSLMRRATGDWLERLGASPEETREITVAVNEAAANAVEHAYGLVDADFVVEGDRDGDTVEFAVRDFGSWRMRKGPSDRGRGLKLARALMDEVEVHPGSDGTVVRLRRRLARGGEAG